VQLATSVSDPGTAEVLASTFSQISLVVNAVVITSAIRGFLVTIFRATASAARASSPHVLLLLLTEFMGLYFFAMVVLLRLGLPLGSSARRMLVEAVGLTVPLRYYHWVHDVVFLLAALLTAVAKRLLDETPSSFAAEHG
jgi:hypothetical protein